MTYFMFRGCARLSRMVGHERRCASRSSGRPGRSSRPRRPRRPSCPGRRVARSVDPPTWAATAEWPGRRVARSVDPPTWAASPRSVEPGRFDPTRQREDVRAVRPDRFGQPVRLIVSISPIGLARRPGRPRRPRRPRRPSCPGRRVARSVDPPTWAATAEWPGRRVGRVARVAQVGRAGPVRSDSTARGRPCRSARSLRPAGQVDRVDLADRVGSPARPGAPRGDRSDDVVHLVQTDCR